MQAAHRALWPCSPPPKLLSRPRAVRLRARAASVSSPASWSPHSPSPLPIGRPRARASCRSAAGKRHRLFKEQRSRLDEMHESRSLIMVEDWSSSLRKSPPPAATATCPALCSHRCQHPHQTGTALVYTGGLENPTHSGTCRSEGTSSTGTHV